MLFKSLKTMFLGGVVAMGALACAPVEAKAESPHGWVNTHPVYQFSYLNPAGRRILFSFHDAVHPPTGRTGIVVTTHRIRRDGQHVGIDIKAIPHDELKEFSQNANFVYRQLFVRGFWDEVVDLAEDIIDGLGDVAEWIEDSAERVIAAIAALQTVAEKVKELVESVMELGDKLSIIFSDKTVVSGGGQSNGQAVARYASNVAHASGMNTSLAVKVGWSFHATMAQEPTRRARRELVQNLVQTIKEL